MDGLEVFKFDESEIRTQLIEDEVWFFATDVCGILDIKNTTQAVAKLDEDERSMLNIGRQGETNIVNEFGLYNLVLSSRKPEAKLFKRWITHEVIPSIRKTGSYQKPNSMKVLLLASLDHEEQLEGIKSDVKQLRNEIDLSRMQKAKLSNLVRKNAMDAVGGKKSAAYEIYYRVAISEHWRVIKNYFEVSSYEEIPKVKFDEAIELATLWTASTELAFNIKKTNQKIETGMN